MPRLLARLPNNFSERGEFEQLYHRLMTGYRGEIKVDRYLDSLGLPSSIKVLKDLHLSLGKGNSFQIDTLIISEKHLCLFEIKNIAGDLYFQTNPNQLIRRISGKVTKMDCPLIQLSNTTAYFEKWLAQRNLSFEVSGQVILANQQSFVQEAPLNAPISFMKMIPTILQEKESQPTIMSSTQLEELIEMIQLGQVEFNPYPLCEYYQIDPNILKVGQLCSSCNISLDYSNHKRRVCKKCRKIVPTDYESTLQDWFMIFNTTMTNSQCRYFLQLKTRYSANYAMKSVKLNKVGQSVATKYIWPPEKPFQIDDRIIVSEKRD